MGDYADDAIDRDINDWTGEGSGDAMDWAPNRSGSEYYEYREIKRETDKAYFISFITEGDGTHTAWVPKSQVEVIDDPKCVKLPNWLAKKIKEDKNN